MEVEILVREMSTRGVMYYGSVILARIWK